MKYIVFMKVEKLLAVCNGVVVVLLRTSRDVHLS